MNRPKHRVNTIGWNDLPKRKPDPRALAALARASRRYALPIRELKRLREQFWRDQRGES